MTRTAPRHRAPRRRSGMRRYGRPLLGSLGAVALVVVGTVTGPGGSEDAMADPEAASLVVPGAPIEVDRPAPRIERDDTALPAASGTGRRVVFSESRQRVWLVGAQERVRRSYPVSGSIYDNLDPGTYEVYSRSEQAWGIDDSGTMRYFVRFARGESAAIGFHDIPVKDGEPVQRPSELGTPLSHGCVRQRRADAIALWEFAPIGTTVVVTG